jgi:hypothetical protein
MSGTGQVARFGVFGFQAPLCIKALGIEVLTRSNFCSLEIALSEFAGALRGSRAMD